jgi:hypothetical protein
MQYTNGPNREALSSKRGSVKSLFFLETMIMLLLVWTACSSDTDVKNQSGTLTPTTNTTSVPAMCDTATHTTDSQPALATPPPGKTSTLSATQNIYNDTATHYFILVTMHKCHEAYSALSAGLQAHEPYSNFVGNNNYTLSGECWKIIKLAISQQEEDNKTWNIGLELAESKSCSGDCSVWYYWDIHLQMQQQRPVIVHIGLYPTGTDCN